MKWFQSLWSCERMIDPSEKLGDLPSDREVYGRILKMALPAVLESFLISMISMADTAMVSGIGNEAIDAVGISGMPRSIALSVIFALNVGVTAIISRRRGEGNRDAAVHCLKQCFLISAGIALSLTAIAILFAEPFLLFAGAQTEYIREAVLYNNITIIGLVFTSLSQTITAGQRAVGITKISMWANTTANVVNLVLNYLLIGGKLGFPALGVTGAAIASLTSYFIAFVIPFLYTLRKNQFLTFRHKTPWLPDKETMTALVRVSGSTVLEQVVFCRIGYFLCNKIFASLGVMEYAAHQICMSLTQFSLLLSDGFGSSAAALLGQALGEGRPDKSVIYVKTCRRLAMAGAVVLAGSFIVFRYPLISIFTEDTATADLAARVMILAAFTFLPQTYGGVNVTALRVAGDTKFVAWMSMLIVTIIRPGVGYLLAYPCGLGLIGAWLGSLTDQLTRFVLCSLRFRSGKWKEYKL